MTTKILTFRVPNPVHAALAQAAAEAGIPLAAYLRMLVEAQNNTNQLTTMRDEIIDRLDSMALAAVPTNEALASDLNTAETLLLCREIGKYVDPQMLVNVRARLASIQSGRTKE